MKQGEFSGRPIFSYFQYTCMLIFPPFFPLFSLFQSYGAFQSARSCCGMSPLFSSLFFRFSFKPASTCLVPHSCFFCLFPCLSFSSPNHPLHLFHASFLMCFFWQDLITRWIMDIPLLLEPSQASAESSLRL